LISHKDLNLETKNPGITAESGKQERGKFSSSWFHGFRINVPLSSFPD